jgi:hypothetical protein
MATVVDIFEINVQPIAEQLSALGAQIDGAKKKYNELKVAQGEYDESTIKAKADVNALTKEYKSIETVINNNTKALYALDKTAQDSLKTRKFEENSIDTNRKLYNSLYNEIVRTKKPTEDQIKLAKELSEALKKQESALGDNRRNVGNYAEGFKSAFGAITQAVPALKGFETAQSGVNMALSANPIGAVVTLLFALKDIFGGNAVVADQLTFAFDALNKGFGYIVDTVVDTVSSFDKLTNAIKHPIDFIKNLGSGMAEATKEGYLASKQLDEFTVANARTASAIAENDIQVQALTKSLKDKTKSEKERIAIANKIADMEIGNTKLSAKLAQDELNIEKLKLKGRSQSAEDEAKIITLQSKVRQAISEQDIANSQRQTRINILLEKEATNALKDNKDEQLKIIEEYNKKIDSLTDEFILSERERLEKSYEKKFESIIGNSAKEVALRTEIERQKLEALAKFDEEANKKIQAQQKKVADEQKAINAKQFNEQIEQNKRTLDLELESVDLSVGTEAEKVARKKEIQLKYLEEQLALTKSFLKEDTQANIDAITKIENAIAKVRQGVAVKDEKATLGSSLGITKQDLGDAQQGLQSIQTAVNAIGSVLSATTEIRLNEIEQQKNAEIQAVEESGLTKIQKEEKIRAIEKKYALEKYEAEKKAFETNKALQIVNAVIAGALGVVSAFQLGPIAGAIAAIAIAATTAAQIAVISSQKPPPPPKFATGVIGLDGAGTGTSDSIDAKLSRGESVMTAKATERFAPILAQMEMSVGNRPNFQLGRKRFATGYIPQGDGGYYARSASASMISNNEMAKSFEMAIQKMPSPTLNYDEFSQFTKSVNSSVNLAEL